MRSLVFILVFLSACQTLPDIDTPNKRVALLLYSYQAALKTVDTMVTAGTIRGEQAAAVDEIIGRVSVAVKAAQIAIKAGAHNTTQLITTANALIIELIIYLKSKEQSWLKPLSPYQQHSQQWTTLVRWQPDSSLSLLKRSLREEMYRMWKSKPSLPRQRPLRNQYASA